MERIDRQLEEQVLLASVCIENAASKENAILHFDVITEMLELQKNQSFFIVKKVGRKSFQHRSFIEVLDKRLETLIVKK